MNMAVPLHMLFCRSQNLLTRSMPFLMARALAPSVQQGCGIYSCAAAFLNMLWHERLLDKIAAGPPAVPLSKHGMAA